MISPLTAEDIPAEATALKAELTEMLPFAPMVSLLIELDKRTGYLDCFTHAGGKQARSSELKRNLLAVLLAHSTNLGLTRMADACGISYDTLAWTSEWYVREETLRAANLAITSYHQGLPLTRVFGAGTLSSSDGQRFPTRGKSVTARAMSRYFAHEGLSTYTHVTDQHTTYGTKVIVATKREAHYVLDEILGNATAAPISEHATDTHGVTLVNFGLFDLLGMQLSPRIRDLGKITLYRAGQRAEVEKSFPNTGPLLTRRLNTDLIAEHWDDLLRLAGSLKFGHATASLLVGKLSASGRQNALAAALKEYGALRRTVYAARYLADPVYRRKISRQLNKGESLHALRRDLLYAHEGMIRALHLEAQTEQAWCLTLVTNAVIAWTTEYYGLAVEQMRAAGRQVDDEVLAHISPAHSENINFFGAIEVDIEGELAQLGPPGTGHCGCATPCSDNETDLTNHCKVCRMEWNRSWPTALVRAVGRWGQPVGVEEARSKRWSELVSLAESGTPTLITHGRSGWTWAVLVPLAELYEPQWSLPTHQVSAARPKLARLVRDAHAGTPQLLHRHYKAVAAVMTADRVINVPPGERLDADELLREGATITLTYDPGIQGVCSPDGDVVQEPEPDFVLATAVDPSGVEIGTGIGDTVAQALALLHRRPTETPIEYCRTSEIPF